MLTAAAALLGTPFCFGKIVCYNHLQLVNTQTDHWALKQSILYASVSDPNACLKVWVNALENQFSVHDHRQWVISGAKSACSVFGMVSAAGSMMQAYLSQFWTRWLRYWEEARAWGSKTQLRGWLSPRAGTHLALSTTTATCTQPVTSKLLSSTAWFGCHTEHREEEQGGAAEKLWPAVSARGIAPHVSTWGAVLWIALNFF